MYGRDCPSLCGPKGDIGCLDARNTRHLQVDADFWAIVSRDRGLILAVVNSILMVESQEINKQPESCLGASLLLGVEHQARCDACFNQLL